MDQENKALNFVASVDHPHSYNLSGADSDLCSWVLMNGDLLPPIHQHYNQQQQQNQQNNSFLGFGINQQQMPNGQSEINFNGNGRGVAAQVEKGKGNLRRSKRGNKSEVSTGQMFQNQNRQNGNFGIKNDGEGNGLRQRLNSLNMSQMSTINVVNNGPLNVGNQNYLSGMNSLHSEDYDDENDNDASFVKFLNLNTEEEVNMSNLTDKEKKKAKRLIRNREIARNCRKRKREKFEWMQDRINQLEKHAKQLEFENKQLRNELTQSHHENNKLQNGRSINENPAPAKGNKKKLKKENMANQIVCSQPEVEVDVRTLGIREIDKLVSSLENGGGQFPTVEAENNLIRLLMVQKDLHSDFGREREDNIKFHMQALKQLLVPNQLSKMTLWSLQQPDAFYDERSNNAVFGGGIWNTLCSEFKLTDEQKQRLISMRSSVKEQRKNISECLRIMLELENRVEKNFDTLKKQMEDMMSITTPLQQAKFLLWIERNQACMHMLNNIWDKSFAADKKGNSLEDSPKQEVIADENSPAEPETLKDEADNKENKEEKKVLVQEMNKAVKAGKTVQSMLQAINRSAAATKSVSN